MSRHRIFVLAIIAACAGNHAEIVTAKHSLYDADFATVYSAVMEVTRAQYPNIDDNPGNGRIATAWHQVQYTNDAESDLPSQQTYSATGRQAGTTPGMSPASSMAGLPTRLSSKRYFIRFDINIMGGRPWRVKVVGHASEWDTGMANPTELHGPARPHWLEGRTDALQVAIYKKIGKFAIPMKEEGGGSGEEEAKTDPASFKGVPEAAGKRLAQLKDTLGKRDYAGLPAQLDADIVWSLGGGTGVDGAMATWQADPAVFDAMGAAIAGGCASDGKRVTCPATPAPGAYQLVLEPRGADWKVTSFVKTE
jgi:hypothetical protein